MPAFTFIRRNKCGEQINICLENSDEATLNVKVEYTCPRCNSFQSVKYSEVGYDLDKPQQNEFVIAKVVK